MDGQGARKQTSVSCAHARGGQGPKQCSCSAKAQPDSEGKAAPPALMRAYVSSVWLYRSNTMRVRCIRISVGACTRGRGTEAGSTSTSPALCCQAEGFVEPDARRVDAGAAVAYCVHGAAGRERLVLRVRAKRGSAFAPRFSKRPAG